MSKKWSKKENKKENGFNQVHYRRAVFYKKLSQRDRITLERLMLTVGELEEDPERPKRTNYIHRQALRYSLLENYYHGKPLGALCKLFLEGTDGDLLEVTTKGNAHE